MEPLSYPERRFPADSWASADRQPLIDIDDVHTLAQGIVDTIRIPFSSSISTFVSSLQTALFVRRSGWLVKILRIVRFARWATGSGIFPRFGSCWKILRRCTP